MVLEHFFYNSVAKIFDISLKREYDPKNIKEDIFIEDILRQNIN